MDCGNGLVRCIVIDIVSMCLCVQVCVPAYVARSWTCYCSIICGAPPYIGTERNGGGLSGWSCLVSSCYADDDVCVYVCVYRLTSFLPSNSTATSVHRLTSADRRLAVRPPTVPSSSTSLSEQGELLPRNISLTAKRSALLEGICPHLLARNLAKLTRAGSHI